VLVLISIKSNDGVSGRKLLVIMTTYFALPSEACASQRNEIALLNSPLQLFNYIVHSTNCPIILSSVRSSSYHT